MNNKITIYGAGYVGLVTGICFAELGYEVLIVDTQKDKIRILSQGLCTIYDPHLEHLLQKNLNTHQLNFSTDLKAGAQHGLFQFIAVGTPSDPNGEVDLRHVFDVASSIAEHMD